MPVADAYLRHVRFGRDDAESTTKSYAGAVMLGLSPRCLSERSIAMTGVMPLPAVTNNNLPGAGSGMAPSPQSRYTGFR